MASLKNFKSVLSFIILTSFPLLFAGSFYVSHMHRMPSYTINNRSIRFGAINTGGNLYNMTDAVELFSNKEVPFKNHEELWSTAADIQQPFIDTQDFISSVTKFLGELPHDSVCREGLETVIKRAKERRPGWEYQRNQAALDTQFLHYMKCPTSLRWKLLQDPFTQRKFLPETPILAWDKHYSDEEYSRLSKYHRVNGWLSMDKKYVSSALAALNSSHNAYLFDDRLANEAPPADGRCITCAVVGNSGVLNGSKMGKEIDAHDYVFRVNTALTNGHEDDVGTRTSFYFFGMVTLSGALRHGQSTGFTYPPGDKGVRYVFLADREWAYSYIAAVLNGQDPPPSAEGRRMIRFPKPLQTEDIKLIHPDFERYLKWSWVNSTNQENFLHRPTTGGIMLLLALHTCDELDVYGFGGSYDKYSEHYYDNVYTRHVAIPHHDNHAENTLWKELHSRRIISLYTRD